jgi:signal transduction histidine kinase
MLTVWGDRLRSSDAVLASVLTLAGQAEAWTVDADGGSRAVSVLAALVATLALARRSRAPGVVAAVVVGAVAAKDVFGGADELVTLLLAGVVAIFAVGVRSPSPHAEKVLLVLLGLSCVTAVAEGLSPASLTFSWLAVGAPWVAGRAVRTSTERADLLEEVTRRRQEEADHQVRLAAAEERARIARDLHDVIGHAVSVMVLQAGAAEQVIGRRPEQAAASLAAIQATGRTAIDDLRRMLGLLRDDDEVAVPSSPPAVEALEALVHQLCVAGLDVELEVIGTPVAVPEGVGMTAFRVTQEALTNVLKHADSARAHVAVRYLPRALALEIRDDGCEVPPVGPVGRGMAGMRERVALYDGSLDAGPIPGGGFRVAAELPLPAPVSVA